MIDMAPPLVNGKPDYQRCSALLGLWNYYRCYLVDHSRIVAPITKLMRRETTLE